MIWVTGCRGLLGRAVGRALEAAGLEWVGTGREVDVADAELVARFADTLPHPGLWIVNCAAYTDVDRAEQEPDACRRTNTLGPAVLAATAARRGAALVHISTDYVFDGTLDRPYREDDPVCPVNVYGRSKAEGEDAVRRGLERHLILRTAWLYGEGPSFVTRVIDELLRGARVEVPDANRGSPTDARWIADIVCRLVGTDQPHPPGTYQAAATGVATRFDQAVLVADTLAALGKLDPSGRGRVIAAPPNVRAAARRPPVAEMACDKLRQVLGVAPPGWRPALRRFLETV